MPVKDPTVGTQKRAAQALRTGRGRSRYGLVGSNDLAEPTAPTNTADLWNSLPLGA